MTTPDNGGITLSNGIIRLERGDLRRSLGVAILTIVDGEPKLRVSHIRGPSHGTELLELAQPKLIELVLQLIAAMTSEHYPIDTSDFERTTIKDHVWRDKVSGWYYYTDETEAAVGPYRTGDEAAVHLENYVRHML